MADVRIRYGWIWIAFIVVTLTGAGLMTSQDPTRVHIGIALLVSPWVLLSLLLAVYYINSRTRAVLEAADSEGDDKVLGRVADETTEGSDHSVTDGADDER